MHSADGVKETEGEGKDLSGDCRFVGSMEKG